jgi:hypothetical protein
MPMTTQEFDDYDSYSEWNQEAAPPPEAKPASTGWWVWPLICVFVGISYLRREKTTAPISKPIAAATATPDASTKAYWFMLAVIIDDRTSSGTSLASVATDFQLKADRIRRLSTSQVDPAVLRCAESVAAYYDYVAGFYQYTLGGGYAFDLMAASANGQGRQVTAGSLQKLGQMAQFRSRAVSEAAAAHAHLRSRFGPNYPQLPRIP